MHQFNNYLFWIVFSLSITTRAFALNSADPIQTAAYTPLTPETTQTFAQANTQPTAHTRQHKPATLSTLKQSSEVFAEIGVYLLIVAVYLLYWLKNDPG